ncbi:MAG: hypothetical protein NT013_26090 [Planctomycetia bacterium]|nr:hypothetical protein [Planctomycetia bacterium]
MHPFKLNRSPVLLVAFAILVQTLGCSKPNNPPILGGPCTYLDFEGTATITALESQADGCWLVFDTKLSEKQPTPTSYRNEGHRILIKNAGGKTDDEWLTSQGISVGAEFDVQVAIITSGTCTPAIFKLPKLPAGSVQD